MAEPCDLSAVEARGLIGRRRLSPVELLKSCFKRIADVNPAVNAVVALDAVRAMAAARRAEEAVMKGGALGALHGLPLGVKDLEETAGLRTTYGSLIFKDHVPKEDERGAAVLRAAGAIVLAKTNTPEFGAGANTRNDVYGFTRNPFDTRLTCAGSSGGSAVALATGMLPICTGSDTGGSLRTPAAFCGVVGFRPSPGLVPNERRPLGWTTLSVRGPMGRSVADAALLLSAQAGYDARDPFSHPVDAAALRAIPPLDLSSLRVGFSPDFGGAAVIAKSVRAAFADRITRLAPAFKSCEERSSDFSGGDEAFATIRAQNFLAAHLEKYRTKRALLGPNVAANVEEGLRYSAEDVARGHVLQTRIFRDFQALFRDIDLFIAPVASVPPFPVETWYPPEIDGVRLESYFHWIAPTYLITLTGNPALSLPTGLGPEGAPFALQLVGPHGGDRFVLAAAQALEAYLAGDPATAGPKPDLARLAARGAAR
jgi:Asp-tRNA(Asn)/Glu-tRNA(Gln) amidotransferase A subunit family amidase